MLNSLSHDHWASYVLGAEAAAVYNDRVRLAQMGLHRFMLLHVCFMFALCLLYRLNGVLNSIYFAKCTNQVHIISVLFILFAAYAPLL